MIFRMNAYNPADIVSLDAKGEYFFTDGQYIHTYDSGSVTKTSILDSRDRESTKIFDYVLSWMADSETLYYSTLKN
ncbi:hypothetical protein OXPF_34000 [Oxobacter pfennigii]|uniref:Uncharacterized protein n=1 Tax=Oxobacter pfennigii TaxID=36849 RepID=A0A0P9ADF8_9CLOT|nr:hypothetical protein OXPF_34000 [Oxobacter pfennigii]